VECVEGRAPARGGRLLRGDASRYAAARSTVPVLEASQGRSHRKQISSRRICSRRISRELICSKQSSAQPSSTRQRSSGQILVFKLEADLRPRGLLLTRCWREKDSNPRSPYEGKVFSKPPPSEQSGKSLAPAGYGLGGVSATTAGTPSG
jgi:hypothetical protein